MGGGGGCQVPAEIPSDNAVVDGPVAWSARLHYSYYNYHNFNAAMRTKEDSFHASFLENAGSFIIYQLREERLRESSLLPNCL